MLERRLLPRLRCVLGARREFFAPVFLFLLHFFVVRDIAWIGHGSTMRLILRPFRRTKRRHRAERLRALAAECPSLSISSACAVVNRKRPREKRMRPLSCNCCAAFDALTLRTPSATSCGDQFTA